MFDVATRASAYDLEGLLSCARGDLFGEGNAKLPMPPMLMMDRITKITDKGGTEDKGEIVAELDINPDLWFFKCHFLGDPVMPGCFALGALGACVGFFLGWGGGLGPRRRRWCGRSEIRRHDPANSEEADL